MTSATFTQTISFGDCDPAGIVFYPNIFRWVDAAFHRMLLPHGGHAAICTTLGGLGIGLVDISAQFHAPMRDGDTLTIDVGITSWSSRSLTVTYDGRVGDTVTFTGKEVRCLFEKTKDGIVAADAEKLRILLESGGV
ncbi:MAG: acyl-CoA thioesterase [Pseudomonadota bacterium]